MSQDVRKADGLGGEVWPGAVVLCDHLQDLDLQSKAVLELGAGAGLCSLVGAVLGAASVTATDEFTDLLEENVAAFAIQRPAAARVLSVVPLTWGPPDSVGLTLKPVDLVIGSEILPMRGGLVALLQTLDWLNPQQVLLSFDECSGGMALGPIEQLEECSCSRTCSTHHFLQLATTAGWHCCIVRLQDVAPGERMGVLQLQRATSSSQPD